MFVSLLAEKPNCGVCFCCFPFVDEKEGFICFCFVLFFSKTCKLYILRYAEKEILLACLMKYLTELEAWFPDIKNQIEALASDEHLCLRGENVTRCFILFCIKRRGCPLTPLLLFTPDSLKEKRKKINHIFHPRIVRAQLPRLFLPDPFVYTSEVWHFTREPRSTGNFHLYLPKKKKKKISYYCKTSTLHFFPVVSSTLHGNKSHPAEIQQIGWAY